MKPRIALLLALAGVATLAVPAIADARVGRCTSDPGSPRCQFWTGKVTFFADGDTLDIDIRGDRRGARHIRLTGINAPELRRYSRYPSRRRGECHARAATLRLERLIRRGHRRVRLAAQHARSRSGHRLRRQISVRLGGRWVDVNSVMAAEGHALFLGNPDEWAWNRRYERLAQQAAARRTRIYNPRGCGRGPSANAPLRMHLNFDASGYDFDNVNGEWARIFNDSGSRVRLAGWWFRDSSKERYRFPRRAAIPAGGSVLLRMGRGRNRKGVFHWGLRTPPFENPNPATDSGDGGYLFDPRGNLRAYSMYPCRFACG
jgi:micrococcal nuclease